MLSGFIYYYICPANISIKRSKRILNIGRARRNLMSVKLMLRKSGNCIAIQSLKFKVIFKSFNRFT